MKNLKQLALHDKYDQLDAHKIYKGNGIQRTDIIIKDEITGDVLFRGSNKVILPGSSFTAVKHFKIIPPVILPNYNTVLSLDQTVTTEPENDEIVCLFALGTDGCGAESSQVYDVKYSKWTKPEALVPFMQVPATSDLSNNERNIYFGRKALDDKILYYFKAFEAKPTLHMQYIDGTPIDSNIYDSSNTTEVETYVEVNLKVTSKDCRDFFKETTGIATAKINSIMLLTAWVKNINGKNYYQNIQPLTKLNISNEPLFDETKGLDIIYHIYY